MTNTRKILAIVMVIAMCFSMFSHTVFATDTTIANGTAGEGITWVLDSDGTLTISGEGEIVVDWYAPPWKDYNESITAVVVEEGITKIPSTAFCYAKNIVAITVPSTVTEIGAHIVWEGYGLEEINVAEDNTTYKDIDGILFTEDEKTLVTYPMNKAGAEYTIPASVETIGEYVFAFNVSLESVVVPDTVTSLGERAFEYSTIDSVILGNGITNIPKGCFESCNIESLIIPDSVTAIENYAFYTANLETLVIGSGVETIGKRVVNATYDLTTIHYKGTQDDWDAISIHEDNEYLNEDEIHFVSDEIKEGTEPTCADGHTEGYYCDDCEVYLTGDVILAVAEHDYDDGVVYGPYCTSSGYTLYTCTACGDSYTDNETEMVGHTIGDDGLCETCGEECVHTDEEINGKCDYCGADFDYEEINFGETKTVHIPEEHEPVIVKFTSTISGWLVLVSDNGGDDDNIDPYVEIYDSNGDLVEDDDDHDGVATYNFYCIFEAEAGETYYIALYSYDSDVEYDYYFEKYIDILHEPTSAEPYVTLTWDVDADYQWYLLDDDDEVAIDGETEATLQNPVIGSKYGCLVTYNGNEYYSNTFTYGYAITHQPTVDEPYVELNDDTDATYQWYSAVEKTIEITDENAIGRQADGDEYATYSAEDGWKGVEYYGTNERNFFEIELVAGQTIAMSINEDVSEFGIWSYDGNSKYWDDLEANEIVEFTASDDDTYFVYAYCSADARVRAHINDYEYTAINGATDAEFAPTDEGLYACEVTFADDSTEMSDVFEYAIEDDDIDNDVNNNSGNTGGTTGGNNGNATNDKNTVKPEKIPNTDASSNNICFVLLLTSAMGIALITFSNKKKEIFE